MKGIRLIVAFLAAAAVFAASAGNPLNVAKLTAFLKSSVDMKMPDKDVSQYLKTVRMTEKLDMRTVEEFQGMGIGPKSVAELERLSDESNSLKPPPPPKPAPPPPPPMPPPNSIEQARIIDAAREYAHAYTKQLPNFLCVEVTRRYYDPSGSESWGLLDTITTKLSYFEQQEHYEVISVTNHPDDLPLDRMGGVISRGEFGSQMKEIFDPDSHASFHWDHWGTLRKKLHYVFEYDVPQSYSHYSMVADGSMQIVPGYKGLVYIDKDTGIISRLTLEPVNIPSSFPVSYAHTTLDYDLAAIGDNMYVLPLRVQLISTSPVARYPKLAFRNDKEFRLYQKFGSEVKINFAPDAIPDDQLKEEPAAPQPTAPPAGTAKPQPGQAKPQPGQAKPQ